MAQVPVTPPKVDLPSFIERERERERAPEALHEPPSAQSFERGLARVGASPWRVVGRRPRRFFVLGWALTMGILLLPTTFISYENADIHTFFKRECNILYLVLLDIHTS